MSDQKQLLRVMVKLMAATMAGFIVYIFISGWFGDNRLSNTKELVVDVSQLAEADIKVIKINNRKVLLLHRSARMIQQLQLVNNDLYNAGSYQYENIGPWFIAYARDPMFGCEIKLSSDKKVFKAVCSDQKYDLEGRPYKNQQSQMKLRAPEYSIQQDKILIFAD